MLIELTYKELEAIQGGAVCRMPNVNNKEGDPFKGTLVPLLGIHETKPIRWYTYLSVLLCKNLK